MAGHDDPKLLYSIPNVKAYHIQNGEQQDLTSSGPQTLSLLMVPTTSPSSHLSTTFPQNEMPDQDFYLHLSLPPELELPMPASTQVYHQPPNGYLIPRWDLGPDSGAFTRIDFTPGVSTEDRDTFETILAQCTAFLERAAPPKPDRPLKQYNPADYATGSDSTHGAGHGQIVLIDEDNGSIVGELAGGAQIVEDPTLKQGTKNPVEIQISADGSRVEVRPISENYLEMARHPAYKDSSIVQTSATASRLIVTGSSYIGNVLSQGADSFTRKVKPNTKPMEFAPATHDRVRKINSFTAGAAGLSSKTVGQASKYVQNMSARLAGHTAERPHKGYDKEGKAVEDYKPGLLNKSMIAFSTLADGIATSGQHLLEQGGSAASTVVGHKYGQEAGQLTGSLAGGVKNCGLVYVDVTGISRRAVIKSVAKGMVVGKVRGGGQVVVGGGDGGVISEKDFQQAGIKNDSYNQSQYGSPSVGVEGFGSHAPPGYSGVGEPMGGQATQGRNMPYKN